MKSRQKKAVTKMECKVALKTVADKIVNRWGTNYRTTGVK